MPRFQLKPSYYLASFFLLTDMGAVIRLAGLVLAKGLKLIVAMSCLIHLLWIFRQYTLFSNTKTIVEFWPRSTGDWQLRNRQGHVMRAQLEGNSVSSLYIIVLNFKLLTHRGRRNVIVLVDSLVPDEFRRLKLILATQ